MRWRDFYREKAPWKVELSRPWKDVVHPMPEDIARLVRDWLEEYADRVDVGEIEAEGCRGVARIFHNEAFYVD